MGAEPNLKRTNKVIHNTSFRRPFFLFLKALGRTSTHSISTRQCFVCEASKMYTTGCGFSSSISYACAMCILPSQLRAHARLSNKSMGVVYYYGNL